MEGPFTKKEVLFSMLLAVVIGFAFLVNGALVEFAKKIPMQRMPYLVLFTLFILMLDLYFTESKKIQPLRILTYYGIGIISSVMLLYVFGVNAMVDFLDFIKTIWIVALPASLGAASAQLITSRFINLH